MKPVIVLGSGGHARVALELLRRLDAEVLGIADPFRPTPSDYLGIKVLGGDESVFDYAADSIELVNGIGSMPRDAGLRAKLFDLFQRSAYVFKILLHPRAVIAAETRLAAGVQVMAGAIIQFGVEIAENTLVNTGSIVEHDCRIGRHVHIAPGAVLCGSVEVGDNTHIGAGATVIQGVGIGDGCVIGAGSVVTRDVGSKRIVYPPRSITRELQ